VQLQAQTHVRSSGEAGKHREVSMTSLMNLLVGSSFGCTEAIRVRREIRRLSIEQREAVFAALQVMKTTSQEEGEEKFGAHFLNYDRMVLKHMRAAQHPRCDMGHGGPAFLTFHRALELQIENSLLAVDPSIEGLPYWSYTPDFETGKPRESEVWTDAFFGSTFGNPEDENMIFNGIGKDWKIHANASELFQRFPVDSRSTDQSPDIVNPFNMLRGPTNMLAAPRLTRSNTTCGSPNDVVEGAVITASNYSICLATPPEDSGMLPFFNCLDAGAQGPHSFYHHWLGGAWGGDEDPFTCAKKQLPDSLADLVTGCLKCPKHCRHGEQCACWRDEVVCEKVLREGTCVKRPMDPDGDCVTCDACGDGVLGAVGDAWDTASSPNDPSFIFSHVNVDRLWMEWQQRWEHSASAGYPYSGFPTAGMCVGHNLKDVISERDPFERTLIGANSTAALTNAMLMDATLPNANHLYTYDSLIGEVALTIPKLESAVYFV